ncbi:MAG: VTT domain-containing protein [Gammaproteobacteria bacterium]|nr:VTT domain-containing protein [Gammaproteobacteria bacterium]
MDISVLQNFFDWLSNHPGWAGFFVFLIALTESLVVVGLAMPGTIAMIGVGALIGAGILPFWEMAVWAMFGAVAGDAISYWVGNHYRDRLQQSWPFNKRPQLLNIGIDFFAKHGGKSVLLGRFFGPVRPIIPAVAGMLEMRKWRFLGVNVLSAVIWAPVTLLPGVVLGASLTLAASVAGRLVMFVGLLLISLWLVVWICWRLFRFFSPRAQRMIEFLLTWATRHPVVGSSVVATVESGYSSLRGLWLVALLALVLMAPVLVVYVWLAGSLPTALDVSWQQYMQGLHNPAVDPLMLIGYQLFFQWPVLLTMLALLTVGSVALRQPGVIVHVLMALGLVGLMLTVLAQVTQVPLAEHATDEGLNLLLTMMMTLLGLLAVIASGSLPQKLRWVPYAIASMLALMALTTAMYFSQGWLSELFVAWLLAAMTIGIVGVALRRHGLMSVRLSAVVGVVLVAMGAVVVGIGDNSWRAQQLQLFSPPAKLQMVNQETWQQQTWQQLPRNRQDLGAHARQVMHQWAASREQIDQAMRQAGWQSPMALDERSWLRWFAAENDLRQLPLLPRVHDGQYEQFKYLRQTPEGVQVMRFWQSQYQVADKPIYLVSVSYEDLDQSLWMLAIPRTTTIPVQAEQWLTGLASMQFVKTADGRWLLWPEKI